jgi:hypothetical protein
MKKPLIPFNWLPASWGLKGKTYEIAKAEYELSGMALDHRLAEIRHDSDEKSLAKAKLDIDKKHRQISDEDYERKIADLTYESDTERKIASLDIDLKHKKIDQNTYEKSKANLLGEPWVAMPKIHWDPL